MSADVILTVPEAELEAESGALTPNAATPYARFLVRTALVRTPGPYARMALTGPEVAAALAQGFAQIDGAVGQVFCVALNAKLEVVAIRTAPAEARGKGYFIPPLDVGKFIAETLLAASGSACLIIVPISGPLRRGDEREYRLRSEFARPCIGAVLDMLFSDGRTTYSTQSQGYV